MNICTVCRLEMHCVKTGKKAVFGQSHVYRGDEFECRQCGARVVVTAGNPSFEPDVLDEPAHTLVLMNSAPPDNIVQLSQDQLVSQPSDA